MTDDSQRFICEEINRPCVGPTPHFIDNSAAYHLVRNVGVSARTKHFERWMHYLRDMYARHVASIHLVPDTCMVADIFTKSLSNALFDRHRRYLLKGLERTNHPYRKARRMATGGALDGVKPKYRLDRPSESDK